MTGLSVTRVEGHNRETSGWALKGWGRALTSVFQCASTSYVSPFGPALGDTEKEGGMLFTSHTFYNAISYSLCPYNSCLLPLSTSTFDPLVSSGKMILRHKSSLSHPCLIPSNDFLSHIEASLDGAPPYPSIWLLKSALTCPSGGFLDIDFLPCGWRDSSWCPVPCPQSGLVTCVYTPQDVTFKVFVSIHHCGAFPLLGIQFTHLQGMYVWIIGWNSVSLTPSIVCMKVRVMISGPAMGELVHDFVWLTEHFF